MTGLLLNGKMIKIYQKMLEKLSDYYKKYKQKYIFENSWMSDAIIEGGQIAPNSLGTIFSYNVKVNKQANGNVKM